jgi:membrane protease YdiL (CAAX protease family)
MAALYLFSDNEQMISLLINRALYSPFVEEGVYRVIAMGAFLRVMNKHLAVAFSAFLFFALHYVLYNPGQFYPTHLASGFIMGYVFIWGKSLGLNAAIHGLGNCGLLLLSLR